MDDITLKQSFFVEKDPSFEFCFAEQYRIQQTRFLVLLSAILHFLECPL